MILFYSIYITLFHLNFKRVSLLTLLLSASAGLLNAQFAGRQSQIKILDESAGGIRLEHRLDLPLMETASFGDRSFTRLVLPGYVSAGEPGHPSLPEVNSTVEIPAGAEVSVRVLHLDSLVISLKETGYPRPLLPVQPSLRKSEDPEKQTLVFDSLVYLHDRFLGADRVSFAELGTMRGVRLGRLTVSPFRYNPSKHLLIVYTHTLFELSYKHPDILLTRELRKQYYSPVFEKTLSKSLNYSPPEEKGVFPARALSYVILADSMFRDSLQEFIRWKTKKGFRVIELYRGSPEAGHTTDDLKNALSQLYHSPPEGYAPPDFLLIVGDTDQIPPSRTGGHVSDLYYATYDGEGDYLPELYFGRFSANTPEELMPQISKTMEYEQYAFPDPSFLGEAVMIAGVDGTYAMVHGNGQINYGTAHYFNPAHGITSHTYLYPESGSSAGLIKQDISKGAGFVNYTGHGRPDRWENPLFHMEDIPLLENTGRYPLMIGNGCETNRFELTTCLGEALLRAEGRGALGYIGGTNDSYWDEDYYWSVGVGQILANPVYEETGLGMYDKVFHENGEPQEVWASTQGQMVFAGNMAVQEGSLTRAKYYWEIYHLMGDPSLMVYFGEPAPLSPSFPGIVPEGISYLNLTTEPYTYAALSYGDTLLDAAYAGADGLVSFHFAPVDHPATLDVVITGQNRRPFFGEVQVTDPDSAYIVLREWTIDDQSGNQNGLADNGEHLLLNISLGNLGLRDATDTDARLFCADSLVSLTDSTELISLLAGQSDILLTGAFGFSISPSAPDKSVLRFLLRTTDSDDRVFDHYFNIPVHAPDPTIGPVSIIDSAYGNMNRRIDPGETFTLRVRAGNAGTGQMPSSVLSLYTPPSMATIHQPDIYPGPLAPGETGEFLFTLTASPGLPQGTDIPFHLLFDAGTHTAEKQLEKPAGLMYEDFETGDLSRYNWQNDQSFPWFPVQDLPAEGEYCLRSGQISHSQATGISLRVYFPAPDTVSFHKKVSSERNWDFLRFLVNGEEKGKWSGESPWSLEKIPVPAGLHTLTFLYTKDSNTSHGLDRAWIDMIRFPGGVYLLTEEMLADESTGNGNHTAEAGESPGIIASLPNPGIAAGNNVTALIRCNDTLVHITDSLYIFTNGISLSDTLLEPVFSLDIHPLFTDQALAEFLVILTDSSRGSWQFYAPLRINAPVYQTLDIWWNDSISGNANGQLDPGEEISLRISLANTGHSEAKPLVVSVSTLPEHAHAIEWIDSVFVLDNLPAGSSVTAVFTLIPREGFSIPLIPFRVFTGESPGLLHTTLYKSLGHLCEDFETADFRRFPWENDPLVPWMITSGQASGGRYVARSGETGHSQSSSLSITVVNEKPDTIRFFRKVSSESGYDFLRFEVNDQLADRWSGEQDWALVKYPVEAGTNKLTWKYTKDGNTVFGQDRAWIDFVVLPAGSRMILTDLALTGFSRPVNDSVFGAVEAVTIGVVNQGNIKAFDIPVFYTLNEGPVISESIADTLSPSDTLWYTFSETADMSAKGSYVLTAWVAYPGDMAGSNDSIRLELLHEPLHTGGAATEEKLLTLYPMPAPGQMTIEYHYTEEGPVQIRVMDLNGRQLISEAFVPSHGKYRHTLYLHTLKPGAYLLHWKGKGHQEYCIFIRQ